MGADIPDSTLVDWCGRAMKGRAPLIERIEADVRASDLLHAASRQICFANRLSGKGRHADRGVASFEPRPWAGTSPPGAVYGCAPDWKEEHGHRHLAKTRSSLQADGHKGYAKLCGPDRDGTPRLRKAAGGAHLHRDVHGEWDKTKSAIAPEALDRIGALYEIEREIPGRPADIRLAARQNHSARRSRPSSHGPRATSP